MRFRGYKIFSVENNKLEPLRNIDGEDLREKLNIFGKTNEENDTFSPLYIKKEQHIILGILVQSYVTELMTYSDNGKNEERQIDADSINDRVFFYIDLKDSIIFIQNKRYPVSTLKHCKTVERLQLIIGKCLNQNINFMPVQINYTIDEVCSIFYESNVKEIYFSNLTGIEVPDGTKIHNPKREWDDTFAQSWNTYGKDDVDAINIKAAKGKSLTKNPIARLCLKLAEIGSDNSKPVFKKMITITDGEKEEIKLEGNENKVYNIPAEKQQNPYEAYEKIIKKNVSDYNTRLE